MDSAVLPRFFVHAERFFLHLNVTPLTKWLLCAPRSPNASPFLCEGILGHCEIYRIPERIVLTQQDPLSIHCPLAASALWARRHARSDRLALQSSLVHGTICCVAV